MTRKLTFLILALFALISGPGAKAWGQKITTLAGITSGNNYYIGATTSSTDYYFYVDGSSTSNSTAGTAKSTKSDATVLKFTAVTDGWTIQFESGNYLGLKNSKDNGKVQVVANAVTWTIEEDTDKGLLKLHPNSTYYLQKNNSGNQFGSYANTQTNVWLEAAGSTPSAELVSLAVSGTPTKIEYEAGEEFDPAGLVVTGTYDDESQAEITSGITWNVNPSPLTAGITSVSVTATVDEVDSDPYEVTGLTVTEHAITPGEYEIALNNALYGISTGNNGTEQRTKVNDITVVSGCLSNAQNKTYYDASHIRYYADSYLKLSVPEGYLITEIVFTADGTWNGSITSTPNTYTADTKTWTGSSRTVDFAFAAQNRASKIIVTFITNKTVESIAVKTAPVKTTYYVGETFDPAGLVITATYDDESAEDITYADHANDFTFEPSTSIALTTENNQVTITYGGKTANQTITVTEAPKYTVSYHTNGDVSSEQVYAGEIQLTAPANVPNGYTYVGWATAPIEGVAQSATYFSSYDVTRNVDLYAVFVIATKGGNSYRLSSTAPAAGDNVIVAGKKDDKYYALWVESTATSTELTIANGVVTNYEGLIWSASYDEYNEKYGIVLNNGTNPLHMNSSALKVASGNQNGTFEFPVSEDGFKVYGNQNTRWMTFNGNFGVTADESSASTLYFFMPVSFSNFCTTVNALSGTITQSHITANTAYYISDVTTINGPVEIAALGNSTASKLIIEDDGQLIHHNAGVNATVKKNITGYGEDNVQTRDGYYLIANPTDNETVANLVNEDDYDLYTFDGAADLEWINMKSSPVVANDGIGYLYANSSNVTLGFAGEIIPAGSNDINLNYANKEFGGFNLLGNPYACNAYLDKPAYLLDGGEYQSIAANTAIAPCKGFFVEATTANQSVTISTTAPEAPASLLSLSVSQNRGNVIDRAIVSFNGNNDLHKFMMNPAHTNIRLAKNGEEFAALSTEAEGELPVNFKAEKDGNYTITVNTENVEANYLHLIDNLTGMDTDLLSTPSYTFDAKTSDYASRFKLVFGVKNDNEEMSQASSFAYINNGEIVISNEGRATLQVIDVLGRIVSSEEINGECRISTEGLTAGLYILNLNGMTQKIVVR